jgi:hypothetical protein
MESIMSWVEYRLLTKGDRDARQLAGAAVANIRGSTGNAFQNDTPDGILTAWLGRFKTPDDYVQAAMQNEQQFCLFKLGKDLETAVREKPEDIWGLAFKLLMLTRRFYEWLSSHEELRSDMAHGKSERISMAFWAKTWDKNCRYPLIDLVATVINNMVLSQHFSVATNRFDGGTQKLRITLEEDGLESLVSEPWHPYIAEDRLRTLLSLMANCELIKKADGDDRFFTLPVWRPEFGV